MQDDEDEDSDSGDEARQTQAKRVTDSDEMWSGPRAEAGTLEEVQPACLFVLPRLRDKRVPLDFDLPSKEMLCI